jgi:sugar lactone lactonase YvrE
MHPCSVGRFPLGLLAAFFLIVPAAHAQNHAGTGPPADRQSSSVCGAKSTPATRVFPSGDLACGPHVEYLGVYSADGKFSSASGLTRLHDGSGMDPLRRRRFDPSVVRPAEVPPIFTLHPREQVVENYESPAHATKPAKGRSVFSALLDGIVTFAYGREASLQSPNRVTTDSKGRIIVSDPTAAAVHILDPKRPIRIAGGPHRRLLAPGGVAVDGEDNIYIADSAQGFILVYDSDGRFLRYIGKRGNEGWFHLPAGMAIDRESRRLYLLDSEKNLLWVLDLEGNALNRIGRYRGGTSRVEFSAPTEIALAKDALVVLDSAGSRIQILDLQGNPIKQFAIRVARGGQPAPDMGLALDSAGNIYISNLEGSSIRVYSCEGVLLSSFGGTGFRLGEFQSPTGLWIDPTDRFYIADTTNRRVQFFQLSASMSAVVAGE